MLDTPSAFFAGRVLLIPAMWISWIINRLRNRCIFEGVEGVDHHGQFFGAFGSEALFDGTGVGAVGNATGVQ